MTDEVAEPAELDLETVATFLPDLPLEADTRDDARFGHGGVAETLRAVVKRCNAPFTIALYGSWGTGKSSVVGILKDCLDEDNIPTVIVDVWKYQADSLRRTVLHEMDRQGRRDYPDFFDVNGFSLDERVEQSTSLATEFKLGVELMSFKKAFAQRRLTQNLVVLLVALLALLVVGFLVFPTQTISIVASVAAGVAAVLATLEMSALLLTPKTRTWSKGKYADPYEFEKEFLRILDDGFNLADRVLIVFDNLDRVGEDKTVEVLTTVKTFLEATRKDVPAKAVFLVPCDDKAIREQVAKRFGDGDEFLRKFFNVSLRLPSFLHTELQDYTLDLLQKTKIPALDDQRIAWMTAKAFRSNPRQVKQFVNVLVAEFLLVHRRSRAEELPPRFAEENVLELALFNILGTRFPGQMERYLANGDYSLKPKDLKQGGEFEQFIHQVANEAIIEDIRSWFTLRHSDHEARLPGVAEFIIDLQDGKLDEASEFISGLTYDAETKHDLSSVVQLRLAHINQSTTFAVSLNTLLYALAESGHGLEDTAIGELLAKARTHIEAAPDLAITRLDPRWLAPVLADHASQRPAFIAAWAKTLKGYADSPEAKRDSRFLTGLITVLAEHPAWFNAHGDALRASLATAMGKDEELVRILAAGEGAATWITQELALKLIESFGEV